MKRYVYFLLSFCPFLLLAINDISDFLIPSFEKAMGNDKYFKNGLMRKDKGWVAIKNLYDAVIGKKVQDLNELRIPKIIHQIWVGSPLPEKYKVLQATWKKFHPDWEYKLWTDEDIDALGLENKVIYDRSKNYGKKADIARIEILYRYGGLYVDTDFECLKSFDPLHYIIDFYVGLATASVPACFNGLIGSKAGHPILREYIDRLKVSPAKPETFMGIHQQTGPRFFTNCLFDVLSKNKENILILPTVYFYPFPSCERMTKDRQKIFNKWVQPESFALHYWHASWNNGKPK